MKMFICNVATQKGETDGYSCLDHLAVIKKHIGKDLFDLVICNNYFEGNLGTFTDWVKPDNELRRHYKVYEARLVDEVNSWRHDSKNLAKTIINLYEERTGPLI